MKKKLDAIFEAFQNYIREQKYFDILYSEKIGYIRIIVEEVDEYDVKPLGTPRTMLCALFGNIIDDVVFSPDNPNKSHMGFVLTEYEETESRRRIMEILETMEDPSKPYYLKLLDEYFKEYQRGGVPEWEEDDE